MMMPSLCSDRRHAFIRSCIYQCDLDLRRSSGRGEQRFRPLQLATRLKCRVAAGGPRKKADDAFRANFERLKAERPAREAAGKS
jgi:hypothetical protein